MSMSKIVKLKESTLARIDELFGGLLENEVSKKMSKTATWDFKINELLDRVEKGAPAVPRR